jgi:hypothetical protein
MLVSRDQNADQNQDIKTGNRSFEKVSLFKYFGMTVTNQNLIQEEIKRRPSIFYLLSKNVNVRIYKTVILFVVLYGCEHGL